MLLVLPRRLVLRRGLLVKEGILLPKETVLLFNDRKLASFLRERLGDLRCDAAGTDLRRGDETFPSLELEDSRFLLRRLMPRDGRFSAL